MTESYAHYATTVAAIILADLYQELEEQPGDLTLRVDAAFPSAADQLSVPSPARTQLLRLTHEVLEIFLRKTDWEEYHALLTGPHAQLIDPQIMLNKRMAQIT